MNNLEIDKIKMQMDFNKTAAEIITKLVNNAIVKGNKVKKKNEQIFQHTEKVFKEMEEIEDILYTEDDFIDKNFQNHCAIGIDGSHYPVGGIGGKWYVPYAIVRILYKNGIKKQPIVDVYDAGIDAIKEQDDYNIKGAASRRMLVRETAALDDWANKKEKSLIFIDGPIIDPPSYKGKDYVTYRCNAVKNALKNSILVGCVKKSRDKFFIKEYEKKLGNKIKLDIFPSDQHLFAYLFSHYRNKEYDDFFSKKYEGPLFSNPVSPLDPTFEIYKKHGIHIYSIFFQKSIDSKILRLDIPLNKEKLKYSKQISMKVAKITSDWFYPKQYIPIPVELAHQKCTINESTAQVLYEEIITRAHIDPSYQIILNQLR